DGPHVAVVSNDHEIAIKRVRLGRDFGNRVVVVDGIRGDERLVINPGDELVDGVRIQIAQPEQAQGIALN
ncbi:MAG: HlyD family multidrug efflux protein, partial [Planctomycetaceae bacterium]|nr:HlyD family multidrug efflux protein [Planctomycetaceae bacterium]